MLNIIGNISFIASGFCFMTSIIVLMVMVKQVKDKSNKKVAELENVIIKPLNSLKILLIVGMIAFILGRILII